MSNNIVCENFNMTMFDKAKLGKFDSHVDELSDIEQACIMIIIIVVIIIDDDDNYMYLFMYPVYLHLSKAAALQNIRKLQFLRNAQTKAQVPA